MNLKAIQLKASEIIKSFPKSKNGKPFLKLKNGRKVFFGLFIKKYGLDGNKTRYQESDLRRRLPAVEFFDWFTKLPLNPTKENNKIMLESVFYRMVILEIKHPRGNHYELLSFYPKT